MVLDTCWHDRCHTHSCCRPVGCVPCICYEFQWLQGGERACDWSKCLAIFDPCPDGKNNFLQLVVAPVSLWIDQEWYLGGLLSGTRYVHWAQQPQASGKTLCNTMSGLSSVWSKLLSFVHLSQPLLCVKSIPPMCELYNLINFGCGKFFFLLSSLGLNFSFHLRNFRTFWQSRQQVRVTQTSFPLCVKRLPLS